jgi:hypothetical protein
MSDDEQNDEEDYCPYAYDLSDDEAEQLEKLGKSLKGAAERAEQMGKPAIASNFRRARTAMRKVIKKAISNHELLHDRDDEIERLKGVISAMRIVSKLSEVGVIHRRRTVAEEDLN